MSCGRAAGEDKRVARQAAPARATAPRAPRRSAPALTLRANHTPNNAAAYYLLLRFICSYIRLMVSDRCVRLRATLRQHPAEYYEKRVVSGVRLADIIASAGELMTMLMQGCSVGRRLGERWWCEMMPAATPAATHMRGQVARKSFIDSRAPAF